MEKRAKPNITQIGLHKVESREMRRREREGTQKSAERRRRAREIEGERKREGRGGKEVMEWL